MSFKYISPLDITNFKMLDNPHQMQLKFFFDSIVLRELEDTNEYLFEI